MKTHHVSTKNVITVECTHTHTVHVMHASVAMSHTPAVTVDCICLANTVAPLMRDHKDSPQKWSLRRGLPYLVGNQEVTPKCFTVEPRSYEHQKSELTS